MYAPHTVTIYNVLQEPDLSTFEDVERLYVTILRGVFVDATKAVNVRTSGLVSADAVNLYIPFSVDAVDGTTGAKKEYLAPQAFWAANDRSGYWTLGIEGNGGETFFVVGEVVESTAALARAHDGAYNVTKVDEKNFGSPGMQHWEVGGA